MGYSKRVQSDIKTYLPARIVPKVQGERLLGLKSDGKMEVKMHIQ